MDYPNGLKWMGFLDFKNNNSLIILFLKFIIIISIFLTITPIVLVFTLIQGIASVIKSIVLESQRSKNRRKYLNSPEGRELKLNLNIKVGRKRRKTKKNKKKNHRASNVNPIDGFI